MIHHCVFVYALREHNALARDEYLSLIMSAVSIIEVGL